ncbi:MAG: metal-dependent hydrolase, partial [Anaerolineales bacterium]|nr:metal-dependent hydrolase [Anaerolineales bacterium]
MLGKSHLLIGTAAAGTLLLAAGVTPAAQPALFAGGLLAGGVGALLPDIDSPNTRIRTSVGLGSRQAGRNLRRRDQDLVEKGLNIVRYVIARILDIVAGLLPHRGLTHWAVTWLGLTL